MSRKSDPLWRQFEGLVARVEAILGDANTRVRSPDKIPDLKTGTLREVDAAIRGRVGSADFLITIECRKRSRRQVAEWIEQLATKKRRIGAAMTIAVCPNGYSDYARAIANDEGIILRTLEEIDKDSLTWARLAVHDYERRRLKVQRVEIELFDPSDDEFARDPDIERACTAEGRPYPCFITTADGLRYDPVHAWNLMLARGFDPYVSCGVGEEDRGIVLECADQGLAVETRDGLKIVKAIHFHFRIFVTRESMPMTQVFRYASQDGTISEGIEFDVPYYDGTKSVLTYRPDTGEVTASIVHHRR